MNLSVGQHRTQALDKLTTMVDRQRQINDAQARSEWADPLRCSTPTRGHCIPVSGICSSSSRSCRRTARVIGVGRVGTRAWIVLIGARGSVEPLFLQRVGQISSPRFTHVG
jgi:hypothetical protein